MSIASRIESMTEHLTNAWDNVDSLGLYAKKLPKEYTQVDYIASSGTQYIDTGIKTNINTKMEADIKCLDNGTNMSGVVYSGNAGWLSMGSYSGNLEALFGTSNDAGVVIPYDNDFHKYYISNGLQRIDDKTGDNAVDSFPTTLNIYLFNYNKNYSGTTSVKQQIKYAKIYEDDELVRDFIPCYRNSDNAIGLYDLVNGVFYTNQGTGVFTYGQIQEGHMDRNLENLSLPLNDLYNKVSNKTDLSQNGVVGRTSQESTTGKNLFDIDTITGFYQSLATYSNGLVTTISLTGEEPSNIIPNFSSINLSSGTYYISMEIRLKSGSGSFSKINDDSVNWEKVNAPRISNTFQKYVYKYTYNDTKTLSVMLIQFASSTNAVYEITNIMLSTSSDTTYEPYTGNQPSPNPDYPQPINNLSGDVPYKISGKNLFVGYNNMQVGFLPSSGDYPTTNSSYPNARYQLIELNQGESISTSGSTSTFGRIRLIDKDTNKVVSTIIDTENDYYISTANYGSGFLIGTITAKKDIILGIMILSSTFADNFQIEKGSTATDFEPYIEPQTFDIPLKSKNLFDGEVEIGGWSITDGDQLTKSTTTHQLRCANKIIVEPNKEYVFSLNGNQITENVRYIFVDKNNVVISSTVTATGKVTTPNNCEYLVFHSSDLKTNYNLNLPNPMIEINNVATNYEPYYDIELCKIGDYQDKIYKRNDKWYLYKELNKVVLNGTETYLATGQGYACISLSGYSRKTFVPYSNYYKGHANVGNISQLSDNQIAFNNAEEYNRVYIINTSLPTVEDFKSWLSTHNTTLYYALATPTTTEITQENYPSLYNALKQIQDYLTAYKINKEFILGYDSPEIEY